MLIHSGEELVYDSCRQPPPLTLFSIGTVYVGHNQKPIIIGIPALGCCAKKTIYSLENATTTTNMSQILTQAMNTIEWFFIIFVVIFGTYLILMLILCCFGFACGGVRKGKKLMFAACNHLQ
jgi:hypothetical protein